MIKLIKKQHLLLKLGLTSLLTASFTLAHASAFQIWEQNGAGTGDYHAGGAAIANDASTVFYNPAGLTRLNHTQVAGGAIAIPTKMEFSGSAKTTYTAPIVGERNLNDSGSADGGGFDLTSNVAPFGYIAVPINDRITAGLGIATPFGLSTDYASDSVVAAYATKTEMKNIDFMPSIGIQLNQQWSLGIGADINYLHAEFDNDTSIKDSLLKTDDDFVSKNSGHAYGYGAHVGVLYEPTSDTRIGLTYHSQVHYDLEGTSKGVGDRDDPFSNNVQHVENHDLKSSVTFPAYTMLSIYHDFTQKWAGMASLTYTQWHTFDKLKMENVANPAAGFAGDKTFDVTIPQHFDNTFNIALGTHYQINHLWTIKGGLGYDKTPTNNDDRNVRLPDSSRFTTSIGAHLQLNPKLGFDLGYTHVFFHDTSVNIKDQDIGPVQVSTDGSVHSAADVIGFQVTWSL